MVMVHEVHGDGSPVVFLHSGVGDRRQWGPQAPLSDRLTTITCDLAGFGDTPLEPGEFSWAEDVIALLDHLALDRVAIVGSSMGGKVAIEVAATWPQRLSSLVLLCAAYAGVEDDDEEWNKIGSVEERLLAAGDVDGVVELNVRTWLGPRADEGVRELVRTMQARSLAVQMQADEWSEVPSPKTRDIDLTDIHAPTTVALGRHDLGSFQRVAQHLAVGIPDGHLVELDWAGHLPNLEDPGETNALLHRALLSS
ncbi:MAG: alpha/beta fold hydrolase [Nocardioidaceae bacterium]